MGTASDFARSRLLKLSADDGAVLSSMESAAAISRGECHLTFHCELVTPALLGGADSRCPDRDQPVRPKDLRGKLRMWWRTLEQAGDLDAELEAWTKQRSSADLSRSIENIVWGSIHDAKPNVGQVRIEVVDDPDSPMNVPSYELIDESTGKRSNRPEFQAYRYALDQSGKAPQDTHRTEVESACRPILCPGNRFRLTISLSDKCLEAAVLKTVWAWMHLGGVGGRNSRGIGAIEISKQAAGALLASPPKFDERRQASGLNCINGLSLGSFDSAESAVQWGLGLLQEFCQGIDVGRNKKSFSAGRHQAIDGFKIGSIQGRSRWPEADTVRTVMGTFFVNPNDPSHQHDPDGQGAVLSDSVPRLAFGHRTIQFVGRQVDGYFDKETRTKVRPLHPDPPPQLLAPQGADRLPSSLLIRPQKLDSGRWSCALVQLNRIAKQLRTMTVPIAGPNGAIEEIAVWPEGWRPGEVGGCDGIKPLELPAVIGPDSTPPPKDAAQAFMNYAWSKQADSRGYRRG